MDPYMWHAICKTRSITVSDTKAASYALCDWVYVYVNVCV